MYTLETNLDAQRQSLCHLRAGIGAHEWECVNYVLNGNVSPLRDGIDAQGKVGISATWCCIQCC